SSSRLALHSFPTRRSSDLASLTSGHRSIRGDYISHATVVRATRTVQVKVVEQRSLLAGSNRPLVGAASRIPDRKAKSTGKTVARSEEHTSELQSRFDLVCR